MRLLALSILILSSYAFAGEKILTVRGENQGVLQMKGWLETIATNRTPGCFKWILDDGAPAYVANTKDLDIEAAITENEFVISLDVATKGFCRHKPRYMALNVTSLGEGLTVFNLGFTEKSLPRDDSAFTHVYLRDVAVFECEYRGRQVALSCEVVMKDGRRLDRNGLGIYIDTKKDKEPISFKFSVN